jgi:translation initiation factor IF-2
LADARAAVAAASTNEGEGRRKKRKEKRQAKLANAPRWEALEKGLDPSSFSTNRLSKSRRAHCR